MAREIRKVRHWKQKWDPNAPMIWHRRVLWGDRYYEAGEPIPDDLAANRKKLRRFWESSWIERADFVPPDELRRQAAEAELAAAGAADSEPDELLESEPEPTPEPEPEPTPEPEPVTYAKGSGSWWIVQTPDGERKVNGKKNLNALLAEYGLPPV